MNDKFQDFLNKLQNADESERDWIVMEFSLQDLSEALQQAIWVAAIPHWFDRDFLNALLANQLKDSDFKALTELSFVEVYPEQGFNVHERSRKLLLNKLWSDNKTIYQEFSKQAAAYCKKQAQNVTTWRVETIYHELLSNSETAENNFIEQALNWNNKGFDFDKLESLIRVVLEAVSNGFVTGKVAAWAAFWQAKLDIHYSRYSSAQDFLMQALKQETDYELTANCIRNLGNVHLNLAEYEQARDYYQKALPIYKQIKEFSVGEANCFRSLGTVYRYLTEYEQARDYYQQALLIFRQVKSRVGEAGCIQSLGDLYRSLAKYEQAQTCYQKALPIYQEVKGRLGEAHCIRCLGLICEARQQTELAIDKLQQAAQLYEKIGNKRRRADCFDDLAKLYRRQKQFEQAMTAFNQAIEIYPDGVWWYQNRAKLYMQMENYKKAEADINQAETIGTNRAYTLLRKAELALWQQQPAQAVTFCQQAHTQRPADGTVRAFFALTLLADEQAEQANNEMQQALTAIYQQHDINDLLGYLDKLAKIYKDSAEISILHEQVVIRVNNI